MDNPHVETRRRAAEALNDSMLSVGAFVEFAGPVLLANNMAHDDPELSAVLVDQYGRLWKEFHRQGEHKLVCILDLRDLTHAINSKAA